jgi:hypothetical protein
MLEQGRYHRVLAAVERPLVFADDDRVPASAGVGKGSDRGGRRAHATVRLCPASKNSVTI